MPLTVYLQGFGANYTLVDDYEQVVFKSKGWWNGLSQAERNTHKNGDTANFIIEENGVSVGNNSTKKRKAWLWDFWSSGTYEWWGGTVNVKLAKPEYIRFGYAEGSGDYYPGGVQTKKAELTAASNTNNTSAQYDTRSPNGKTVFTRSINHTDNWNYNENQAVFLSTIVGYNVRMKTITTKDFTNDGAFDFTGTDWTENTEFQIVVIEFDASTYLDARYDKWDDSIDAPQTGDPQNGLLPGSDIIGNNLKVSEDKNGYYRVYFIVRK